jgi:hypothetical protein
MTARKTLIVSCISLFAQLAHGQVVQQGVIRLRDSGIEYFSEGKGQPVVLLPGGSLTIGYMEGLCTLSQRLAFRRPE